MWQIQIIEILADSNKIFIVLVILLDINNLRIFSITFNTFNSRDQSCVILIICVCITSALGRGYYCNEYLESQVLLIGQQRLYIGHLLLLFYLRDILSISHTTKAKGKRLSKSHYGMNIPKALPSGIQSMLQ